jgi:hypothetical protein
MMMMMMVVVVVVMMMMMTAVSMTRTMKHDRIGRKLSCLVPVGLCFMTVRLIILPDVLDLTAF